MIDAWKRVKANKGAPGIDNMPVDDFAAHARKHWDKIRSALCAGTYQPLPVKRVEIGPLSPLLANIFLDDPDKELERRGHRFSRYADDFIILVKSRQAGERVMANICRFLGQKLKLTINQEKSKVASTNEISFLGFIFKGAKVRWSDKAFAEFKRRVRKLTGRSWSVSMGYRYFKLAQYLRGWMGYYGISECYRPIPEIDHWLRRRLRMCCIKRWRWCRTKVRELVKLGTNLRVAISLGLSRKGPWRLSRTLATQTGITNE